MSPRLDAALRVRLCAAIHPHQIPPHLREIMYGDTHVTPTTLFDPRNAVPPRGAYEVYLPAPTSLSLFAQTCAGHTDTVHLLAGVVITHQRAIDRAVQQIQHAGGYTTGPDSGRRPARLEITAVAEDPVAGTGHTQLHAHVYVGPTAQTLSDSRRRRVVEADLRIAADIAWIAYNETLIAETTSALELTWGPLPGHHPGDQEILQSPFGHLAAHRQRSVCPGRYTGPMTRIFADADWRDDIARMQQAIESDEQRR